ncbi:ATP-dependent DNA helicase 2 subunit KU70-like [Miscanthus floridulus]|uniref:ATP-dependent DNA helicase 2 subunit KU70-like n=1 Tax=Miscanthus floridulus TaxID=154761 RepID=UPI00345B1346
MVVYLVDASPKMFTPSTTQDNEKQETHFHTIVSCITMPGVVKAIEEFKTSVYGENYDQEEAEAAAGKASRGDASKKRKEITDAAAQLKQMTAAELKSYLTAHDLPVSGKKEVLVSRILTHLGK